MLKQLQNCDYILDSCKFPIVYTVHVPKILEID